MIIFLNCLSNLVAYQMEKHYFAHKLCHTAYIYDLLFMAGATEISGEDYSGVYCYLTINPGEIGDTL